MDERAVERTAGIMARTFGNTVSPVVSALMAAAAVATGDPTIGGWAIPTAALAGVLAEEAVTSARLAWSAEGVQQFADALEAETGESVEDTLVGLKSDRASRRLLGEAVAAAADATDEWRIRVLARAFVAGARDGSRVDEMRMLIRVLDGVEAVDARVLSILYEDFVGKSSSEIIERDGELEPVVELVLYRLFKADLAVAEDDDYRWSPSRLGRCVAGLLLDLGLSESQDSDS